MGPYFFKSFIIFILFPSRPFENVGRSIIILFFMICPIEFESPNSN